MQADEVSKSEQVLAYENNTHNTIICYLALLGKH